MVMKEMLLRVWNGTFGRLEKQYIKEFNRNIGPSTKSLLDVGCGFNSPVQHLRHRPERMVGVDAFLPAIEQSRAKGIHDEYYQMSLFYIGEVFGPESFDCVIAAQVIEHLPEKEALDLISEMEKIARHKIIISTPNGFVPQGEEFGNPFQKHLSGWTVKQMESMFYSVVGYEGYKFSRGERARMHWWSYHFWAAASMVRGLFPMNRPAWAYQLLCVKQKKH